uniref:Uncharacterized protein n=1 Tax=Penaeus semisulcatus majanivirus TaxID=2984274 RepID=A0A9C7EYD1_9VIRU|nr:MAG: hypothetical protein [Penaeus semisulcatus majanivirus]
MPDRYIIPRRRKRGGGGGGRRSASTYKDEQIKNDYHISQGIIHHTYKNDEINNIRNRDNWRLLKSQYNDNNNNHQHDHQHPHHRHGWQQLIDDHRVYRNFRKRNKAKSWSNASDEHEGVVEMISYLNSNNEHTQKQQQQQRISLYDTGTVSTETTEKEICDSVATVLTLPMSSLSQPPLLRTLLPPPLLSSSLSSSFSSSPSYSSDIPEEGIVKVFSLSSRDNNLFATVARNVKTFSYHRDHILYLAVIAFIFLRESSLVLTPTDMKSMFNSPVVESLLKKLIIILQYEKKTVETCMIIYNVERVAYDVICDYYNRIS